ncbi:hypothetical protein SAMN04487752_2704 [Carnobacterium viridans]|uniref:Uncharacterized protein n=1 Tax=Carnobacterium viridans TaxID=174587 RepID=A0A1H1BRB3_9LACT|nr:hypothetical protein SAMN04487752_2704 [Carnobacterium viridans]
MIGNLRLFIHKFIKQQITCEHDYKYHELYGHPYCHFDKCKKCGKTKY